MNACDVCELIYSDALNAFGAAFDAEMFRDGLDLAEMERDCRDTFASLETSWLDDERSEHIPAADIFDAVREAGGDVGVPSEWLEH